MCRAKARPIFSKLKWLMFVLFVRKSAELLERILTIKTLKIKEMITNVIISFMVGVRRLSWFARVERQFRVLLSVLFALQSKSTPASARKPLEHHKVRSSLLVITQNKRPNNKCHLVFYGGR